MQEIAYSIAGVTIFRFASKPLPLLIFFQSLKCTSNGVLWEYVWMKGDGILPRMQPNTSSFKGKIAA